MNRQERRRKRLQSLITEARTQKELAQRVDQVSDRAEPFPPNYISQMLHGHRPISDHAAADFEQAMGKPDGWMDQWLPDEGGWAVHDRNPDWYLLDRLREIEDDTTKKLIREQIVHASKGQKKPKRGRKAG